MRGELARLLREEVTDPRIGLVTLTRVDVSPDLRNANVFWSSVGTKPDDPETAERVGEGLASAAGFLRRRLAGVMPTKRVPELRFRHDPSLALGSETLGLLRDLEPTREDGDGPR